MRAKLKPLKELELLCKIERLKCLLLTAQELVSMTTGLPLRDQVRVKEWKRKVLEETQP